MKFIRYTVLTTVLVSFSLIGKVNAQAPDCLSACDAAYNDCIDNGGTDCDQANEICEGKCDGIPVNGNVWALWVAGTLFGIVSISGTKIKKSIGAFVEKTLK